MHPKTAIAGTRHTTTRAITLSIPGAVNNRQLVIPYSFKFLYRKGFWMEKRQRYNRTDRNGVGRKMRLVEHACKGSTCPGGSAHTCQTKYASSSSLSSFPFPCLRPITLARNKSSECSIVCRPTSDCLTELEACRPQNRSWIQVSC